MGFHTGICGDVEIESREEHTFKGLSKGACSPNLHAKTPSPPRGAITKASPHKPRLEGQIPHPKDIPPPNLYALIVQRYTGPVHLCWCRRGKICHGDTNLPPRRINPRTSPNPCPLKFQSFSIPPLTMPSPQINNLTTTTTQLSQPCHPTTAVHGPLEINTTLPCSCLLAHHRRNVRHRDISRTPPSTTRRGTRPRHDINRAMDCQTRRRKRRNVDAIYIAPLKLTTE
jgi:hypothetical protein